MGCAEWCATKIRSYHVARMGWSRLGIFPFAERGQERRSSRCYEVATGSHDGSLRIFDIRTGCCRQETPLHQQKFGEACHYVSYGGSRLATAGADANIMVLGPTSE